MQKKLFSIRDSKGEIYNSPFVATTPGDAERSFTRVVNDPQSTINQFPEDFDLYHLGSFDDVSGKITVFESPQHVVKAVNLVKARTGALNDGATLTPLKVT